MYDNWIKILESNGENSIFEYIRKEFKDNNIEYKIELQEDWEGSKRIPKYIGKFMLYVQQGFESEAEKIIDKYYEKNEIVNEIDDSIEEDYESNIEIESEKINKKQKRAIKIYVGIIICMSISLIIVALLKK